MEIKYIIDKGIILNSKEINWGDTRDAVRGIMNDKHEEDDKLINFAQFWNEDENMNVQQNRDVYENIYSENDKLFLSYDKDNKLIGLEVFSGYKIWVDDIQLEFGKELMNFIIQFEKKEIKYEEPQKGYYIFPNLKMVLEDSESNLGSGTDLSYFYATSDISHLA